MDSRHAVGRSNKNAVLSRAKPLAVERVDRNRIDSHTGKQIIGIIRAIVAGHFHLSDGEIVCEPLVGLLDEIRSRGRTEPNPAALVLHD